MARKKLYYTADEITTGLYTPGNEFTLQDGTPYIGQYHRYETGEIYTGATWQPKTSKLLTPTQISQPLSVRIYRKLNSDLRTNYIIPKYVPVVVTSENIQQTYVKRFIMFKHTDKTITEVDLSQYEQWQQQNIDQALYDAYAVNWYISGPLYTETVNGITRVGVVDRNINTIRQLKNTNTIVAAYFSNPVQFYTDTTVNVPKNINELDF